LELEQISYEKAFNEVKKASTTFVNHKTLPWKTLPWKYICSSREQAKMIRWTKIYLLFQVYCH